MSGETGKPIYVLGTGLSHDGSACLLKDGRICVAIEKERITRRKHDGHNDSEAIRYCLSAEGITMDDVALVAQNANFGMLDFGNTWWYGTRLVKDRTRVVTISHHLAHAYSAIAACPFAETAVLVIDGCGNALDECMDLNNAGLPSDLPSGDLRKVFFEKDSYYLFRNGKLTPVYKDFSPWGLSNRMYPMHPNTTMHSIGGLYLGASMYAFNGFEDPGKLMGLAPYGRPGIHDFEIFDLREGRAFVRYDWMTRFRNPAHSYEQLKDDFQYYADMAYWVQREVERAILYIVQSRYEMSPSENLAYAGGVALNAVANRRIHKESPFKNLYIQPAAGDNGLAIGCALYGWMEVLGGEKISAVSPPYFGRSYQPPAVEAAIDARAEHVTAVKPVDYISRAAEILASGKVVAWFQGGSEFGPRALGHRSILADPRREDVRNFINAEIKFREDFRPFAPSVPLEDAAAYFDCDCESPYMLMVAPVKSGWREIIAAVVHEDNSARLQTVTRQFAPDYYDLLLAFKELTGISVLLNTSLNRKGMPIVETPAQAISFFLSCHLDVLILDGYIIEKRTGPDNKEWNTARFFEEDIRSVFEKKPSDLISMRGKYRIDVTGKRSWILDIGPDQPGLFEGTAASPADVVVEISESDLQKLHTGSDADALRMYNERKIKIDGNLALAANVPKILRLGHKGS